MGFFKTKRADSINPDNGSIVREKSRDNQLISQKNSQVLNKFKDEHTMKGVKQNPRYSNQQRQNSKLSLKSKQSLNKI